MKQPMIHSRQLPSEEASDAPDIAGRIIGRSMFHKVHHHQHYKHIMDSPTSLKEGESHLDIPPVNDVYEGGSSFAFCDCYYEINLDNATDYEHIAEEIQNTNPKAIKISGNNSDDNNSATHNRYSDCIQQLFCSISSPTTTRKLETLCWNNFGMHSNSFR